MVQTAQAINDTLRRQGVSQADAARLIPSVQLLRWRKAPWKYIPERLGVPLETLRWSMYPEYEGHKWDGTPDPLMAILEALARGQWVAVESAIGTGKTFLAACVTLWFLECWPGSKVVTTAPRERSLKMGLWAEMGKLHPAFGLGELQSLMLKMDPPGEDWIAIGLTAGVRAGEVSATKIQGIHAAHLLIILEEAPGIPEPIVTALTGTTQGAHNIVFAIGNPDHQLDSLHQFSLRDDVVAITISGFDHPNVVTGREVIPGAASKVGLQRLLARYKDPDSPLYKSRARGICPTQGTDAVIRLEWLHAAALVWDEYCGPEPTKSLVGLPWCVGQDVANSEDGDKAARAIGRGDICEEVTAEPCPDCNQLGRELALVVREKGIDYGRIAVDGQGVGAGTVNELKAQGITVGETCTEGPVERWGDVETYASLRAQMYFQLRDDLQHGRIGLPYDLELFADLTCPRWEIRMQKIYVESKKDIKKRLSRSPDRGDAVVYWNWVRASRLTIPAGLAPAAAVEERPEFGQGGMRRERSSMHAERKRRF